MPRLLQNRSAFAGTLILGVVVAAWHVPLIWLPGENLPPIFILATVAHATEGTLAPKFAGSNGFTGADLTRWTLFYTAGWLLIAAAVLIFDRQTWGPTPHWAARKRPLILQAAE